MASPAKPPARPYKRGAVALGSLIPEAVAPILSQRGFASTAILTEWREIVGPHLAQWTNPIEIRWPRRPHEGAEPAKTLARPSRTKTDNATRATLVIGCASAFALDIQMATPAIIEAVNRRLGYGCIGSIQILQGPRKAPVAPPASRKVDPTLVKTVEGTLGDIENAELRQALATLGAEIAARSPQRRANKP
ncbi:MAG: hypothetical protein CFE31_09260 [Rhizobiales bacterium PAR1]|nr:MAG: hypothetical protein CFE31_09260 [Rhizobiales bacterium PAR1]